MMISTLVSSAILLSKIAIGIMLFAAFLAVVQALLGIVNGIPTYDE